LDLGDEFRHAVDAALTVDFTACMHNGEVNLFESTIRILGRLLAAYDLTSHVRLVSKLVEVGDLLDSAFRTPNSMPCNHYKLEQVETPHKASDNAPLTEVGILSVEIARLSRITGRQKYMDTVELPRQVSAGTQHESSIPGLWKDEN
jgi:mannosyl-oligosaccharide alpha-1,2-mannosidase